MTANELRIGNIIRQAHATLTVVSISSETVVCDDGNNHVSRCHYKNVDPILLTDNLMALGFKTVGMDYIIMLNTPDRNLIIMEIKDFFYPVIEQLGELSGERTNVVHLNRIKFIHELQNLYYTLTGEELAIVKFIEKDYTISPD